MSTPEPDTRPEASATEPAEASGERQGTAMRDRPGRRAAARAFRPRRKIAATVTAAALSIATMIIAIGAVTATIRGYTQVPPWTWIAAFGRGRWDDPVPLAVACVALLLGLVLLALAFLPGRSRIVPLASEDPRTVTGITRSGLRRHLARVAAGVDGVSRAKVRLRRRVVRVRAATPLRDPGDLPRAVSEAVEARLDELRPLRPIPVRVTVQQRDGDGAAGVRR